MFLKGIKDKFKQKSGRKFIHKALANPAEESSRGKGIRKLGCIVDLDKFQDSDVFYEFLEEFKLTPNAVKIIGYRSYYDKNSPYSTPVFSDKDLGWKGVIENSYALEFLSRDYDLLINYFDQPRLLTQLMSIKTKAVFRIGFSGVDPVYNDLILESPLSDFETFKKELKKYLALFTQLT